MEFIESILKKERVKDDSKFERIILSIGNFTKFLDDFNRKRLALKVSSGDSLGLILSHACFPGLDSLNENVQLNALLLLQLVVSQNIETELRWYHVPMYEFLLKALSTRNPDILCLALDVSFEASEKLENKLTLRPNFFRFLERMIDISVHSVREVRHIYASKMEPFIQSSGVHTMKYASVLLPWLLGLVSEGPLSGVEIKDPLFTKVDIARSLKAVVKYSWPSLHSHKDYILAGVCRGVIVNSNVVDEKLNRSDDHSQSKEVKKLFFKECLYICQILYLTHCQWFDQQMVLLRKAISEKSEASRQILVLQELHEKTRSLVHDEAIQV